MTDDAAWPLAQHVCRTGYADLPASAIRSARRDILDTFGWHCQLKPGWYPPAVGGAAVQCREVLGTPIGLPPSQERGAKKVDSTELS